MRFMWVVLATMVGLILACVDMAEAAKKKTAPPAPPKAIYEAPMRVFIVRNSSPACEPNCPEWIGAEGELTGASPAQFRKALKQMGKKKLPVIIRSPGGSINAALEIGQMIRKAGLNVAVGYTRFTSCSPADKACKLPPENKGVYEGSIDDTYAFCNSACPLILAGGATRFAGPSASIGLHEPKTIWTSERVRYRETYKIVRGKKKVTSRKIISRKTVRDKVTFGLDKRLRKRLTAHYKTMGVDIAILDDMVKAKYQDIYYISEIRKSMLKLVTASSSAVMLANPKFCGSISFCVLRTAKKVAPANPVQSPAGKTSMSFRVVRNSSPKCEPICPEWIATEGIVTAETIKDFKSFAAPLKGRKLALVLGAINGQYEAAVLIGRHIKESGFDTVLGRTELTKCKAALVGCPVDALLEAKFVTENDKPCDGVCTVLFAGGLERTMEINGVLRLTKPDSNFRIEDQFDYYHKMGATVFLNDYLRQSEFYGSSSFAGSIARSVNLATWIPAKTSEMFQTEACLSEKRGKYCHAKTVE